MRARRNPPLKMLGWVDLEEWVPLTCPLRAIKGLADRALGELSTSFDLMHAEVDHPSIPPERTPAQEQKPLPRPMPPVEVPS
jgi:hypothetical protein